MSDNVIQFPSEKSAHALIQATAGIRASLEREFPGVAWGAPVIEAECQYIEGYLTGLEGVAVFISHEVLNPLRPWVVAGPVVANLRRSSRPDNLGPQN